MLAFRRYGLVLWFGLVFSFFTTAVMAQDQGWSAYKSRFLMPDGRIIDTANKNVSHTEGQGFSMLLAVFNDDQATFDKLWQWANTRCIARTSASIRGVTTRITACTSLIKITPLTATSLWRGHSCWRAINGMTRATRKPPRNYRRH